MKLDCAVLSVTTNGDKLIVIGDARARSEAEWKSISEVRIEIPTNNTACRTYYVGRKFTLTVQAK